MSYTNGIGNLQQALSSITPAETKPSQQVSEAGSAATRGGAASTAVQTDHADLSAAGGALSRALEGSDVRMEKVQALQQAIASGSYHVSSSDVADKLIQSLMD